MNQSHTFAFGAFIVVAFLGSVLLLFGRLTLGQGICVATAVCSPAVMLAIERANMDLLIFVIMTTSVVIWRKRISAREVWSPALVLFAAVGKLYPVVALPAFLFGRNRRSAVAAAIASFIFLVYALTTRSDISSVLANAPQGEYNAYGARILIARLYHLLVPAPWEGQAGLAQFLALFPLVVLGASLWVWTRRRHEPSSKRTPVLTGNYLSFCFGTLLFLGTFAAGNNFDYRLVFLLLALPQLFEWIGVRTGSRMRLSTVTLGMVLILVWIGALSRPLNTADEIVSWGVAALFLLLLARSIPKASTIVKDFDFRLRPRQRDAACE